MVTKVIYLTTTGAGTWTVPSDWNSADNTIECIGGGGSGGAARSNTSGGGNASGGGGGAYAKATNLSLTPGALVSYNIGDGGAPVTSSGTAANGNAGGDTWFGAASFGAALVGAKGGNGGVGSATSDVSGVSGGLASASIGAVKYDGGGSGAAGPGGTIGSSSGGGGAAGPNGAGNASPGVSQFGGTGGSGDAGFGGAGGSDAGGAGGSGVEWGAYGAGGGGGGGNAGQTGSARDGGAGGAYGAGGGGGGQRSTSGTRTSGAGAQGLIVITYDAITSLTVTLTGVAASPAAGVLTIKSAVSVSPSGVAAAPAAGIIAAKGGARSTPTGVAAAPVAGTPSARGGARATPTGVAASPAAGAPAITLRIIVTPTGVAASPAVGTLTARGGARAAPTGVAASPAAGSPIATGGARLTLASVAADPAAGDLSTFGVFDSRFILSPDKAGQYLIEITAYQAVGTSGGVAAISEIPVGALPRGAAAGGGQITLRYADVDWIGDPADAWQPNVQYDGRVALPLHAERLAPLYPEESRRVQRQFGAIEIMNSDGALDNIIRSFGVGGRAVRVLFGPYMESYSEFSLIASMVAVGWQAGEDTVRLELRDLSNILAQPLQANLYAGTGGVEGTTDIAGKPKPLFFGECDNVTPTLVDPLNLIYQAHDGAMQSIDAVYDRGGALTLDTSVGTGGDVADYAALVAATVGASKFATCLAEGFVKLGSSPAGIVTVTGKGDKTGGVYSDALDVIALRIIMARGGVDSASVDATSFATLASFGGPVCLYVSSGETPSGADLVDRLVASVGGWWGSTRGGRIEAGRLNAPETAPVDRYIDQYDILSIQPEPAPVVRWRHRVGWGRNWTVQTGDLDVTVSDARRQFLRSADRVATASDGGLLTSHASAVDAPLVETLLVNEADATAVAAYLQALFGVERSIYRITVKRLGYLMKHGDVLHITYPRFDMTSGKKFIVIGIAEDAGSEEIELRVWG